MTYSIMGYDPKTGQIGVASATCTINCSRFHMPYHRGLVPWFQPNGALIMPQASSSYIIPFILMDLIEKGASNADLEAALLRDKNYNVSQIGVVRSNGEMWVNTQPGCLDTKMHIQTSEYIVMGNVLAGEHVFRAMAHAFEAAQGQPLHEKLMLALEAGRDSGGQLDPKYGHLPELWAMDLVLDGTDRPLVDLRVDYDVKAIEKLRQLVHDIVPLSKFYDVMTYNPEGFREAWKDESANLEMKLYWRDTAEKKTE